MKVIHRLGILVLFLSLLIIVIGFARGYRLDLRQQNLTSTGIIAVSAFPRASKVYINGELKGVSDINLTLPQGHYEVEVKKDGYTSWKKTLALKGELVLSLDVLLYPINPSLSPLTNLSIIKAVPINQSNKTIIFSESGDDSKDGIYIFEENQTPIPIFTPLKLLALKKNLVTSSGDFNLGDTEIVIAPDSSEAIFSFKTLTGNFAYLLSLSEENEAFFDITSSTETLVEAWSGQKEELNQKILEAFPDEIYKIASDSFQVVEFSPDETKLIYLAKLTTNLPTARKKPLIAVNQTPETRDLKIGELYVYDKKEDRNYRIDWEFQESAISWYSDSKHIVINEGKKLSFLDFDGENKQTVYSGSFDPGYFKVASDGKLLILTNLNPEANQYPDLYAVGIR